MLYNTVLLPGSFSAASTPKVSVRLTDLLGHKRLPAVRRCAKMEPFWLHMGPAMPTSLTLKNIPDAVYERLKAAAELHRRSLNSEAIVCLESVLLPNRMAPSDRLARARELRASLPPLQFTAKDIDAAKRAGRK